MVLVFFGHVSRGVENFLGGMSIYGSVLERGDVINAGCR